MLEQIGVRAGMVEDNFSGGCINFVDEHPISLNMTFKAAFPFAVKRVILAFRREWLFIDNHGHNIPKFLNIFAAFFRQLPIFFERAGKFITKHEL